MLSVREADDSGDRPSADLGGAGTRRWCAGSAAICRSARRARTLKVIYGRHVPAAFFAARIT